MVQTFPAKQNTVLQLVNNKLSHGPRKQRTNQIDY